MPPDARTPLQELASRHIFPHNTSLADFRRRGPRVIARGEGVTLWDEAGKAYLDGTSMMWCVNIGHGRREMRDALLSAVAETPFVPLFHGYVSNVAARAAGRLSELLNHRLPRVYFVAGGAEGIETAIKLARLAQQRWGHPAKRKLFYFNGTFHGTTLGALSACGTNLFRAPWEPLFPEFIRLPIPSPEGKDAIEAFLQILEREDPEQVAAVIMEPVMTHGGVRVPPREFMEALRRICSEQGIVLIFDEVVTGFGRTGPLFGCQHFGILPDLLVLAKALTGGYVPAGAVLATEELADTCEDEAFPNGITFGGHPLAAAAILANLDIFAREELVKRSLGLAPLFASELARLKSYRIVDKIGQCGLSAAIDYHPVPGVAGAVADRAWQEGIYLHIPRNRTYVAPPLVTSPEEIRTLVASLERAMSAVCAEL